MGTNNDMCEIFCFDEAKVTRVKQAVNNPGMDQAVKIFKALADETRAKIAFALCQEEELCVCDVAHIAESSLATASHHLRLLRRLGLAKFRKEGKLAFYSLEDEHVREIILLAMNCVRVKGGVQYEEPAG